MSKILLFNLMYGRSLTEAENTNDLNIFPVHQPLTAQHRQLLPYRDVWGLVPDVDEVHGLGYEKDGLYYQVLGNTVITSNGSLLFPIRFISLIQTYQTFASAPMNRSMLIPTKIHVENPMIAVQC